MSKLSDPNQQSVQSEIVPGQKALTNPQAATGEQLLTSIAELNELHEQMARQMTDKAAFVIPTGNTGIGNDAEMCRIREVLITRGIELIETPQGWGAGFSAEKDPDLHQRIKDAQNRGKTVIGIELSDEVPEGVTLIDHHNQYVDRGSALLQVLALLDQEPTREDFLIAANDTGWIPAMLELGASLDEALKIREMDWQAQGITDEQILQAKQAVAGAKKLGATTLVECEHSKTSPITDLLYSPEKDENVLIVSKDGEVNFFGPRPLEVLEAAGISVEKTNEGFKVSDGWCGGAGLPERGFVGFYPDEAHLEAVKTFLSKREIPEKVVHVEYDRGVKCHVSDPIKAAELTGGVTFEKSRGWWTYTRDPEVVGELGGASFDQRDALYIPTLQKNGEPVDIDLIEDIQEQIEQVFGLDQKSSASGVWILSETGQPQLEYVWIMHAPSNSRDEAAIESFAKRIREITNQDSIAYEIGGELRFFPPFDEPEGERQVVSIENAALEQFPSPGVRQDASRLWVVPNNDGEATATIHYLLRNGESVLVSNQPWGASWENLEPDIQTAISNYRNNYPERPIYGIELRGPNTVGATDIDNHNYGPDDDRSAQSAGLKHISDIVGVPLEPFEKLVAANDDSYTRGMRALGASTEQMLVVRAMDRSAQGITASDEARARLDLQQANWSEGPHGKRVMVNVTTRRSTVHADLCEFLPEEERPKELLFISAEGISYYGPRHREFRALQLRSDTDEIYSGGSDESGYFGIENPSAGSTRRIISLFNEE